MLFWWNFGIVSTCFWNGIFHKMLYIFLQRYVECIMVFSFIRVLFLVFDHHAIQGKIKRKKMSSKVHKRNGRRWWTKEYKNCWLVESLPFKKISTKPYLKFIVYVRQPKETVRSWLYSLRNLILFLAIRIYLKRK